MTTVSTHPAHSTVTDPQAAAYLANPHRAVFLYPFIGRERTASEVARTYKVDIKRLLFQIRRMTTLGLLTVTRTESRRGSPVKHYRATADAFFVPLEVTGEETLEAMVNHWSMSLQPLFLQSYARAVAQVSSGWGVRISRDPQGLLHISPAISPEADWNSFEPQAPMVMEGWLTDLRLDFEDAKAFQYELGALYLKYVGRNGATRYIARMAIAPMADSDEIPPAW